MRKMTLRAVITFFMFGMFLACQKETSVENGGFAGAAQGTLTDSVGNCKGITVSGSYVVDTTLGDSNYIKVNINFTTQGKYLLSSDTVNGMWFLDSGYALSTGAAVVKVRGKGKPLLGKASTFTLGFNGNYCSFIVTASGTGSATGGNTGGTVTGSNGDYFPTTSNSIWAYRYLPKLGTTDTFNVQVAPTQILIDSLSYSQFATSLGDTFYFAKNSTIGNYYALSTIDFDYTFLFDSIPSFYITYPILKENANVNDTWQSPEYGTVKLGTQYGKAKAVFTIITKNTVPYTIGGKTYQNVINVKRDIQFQAVGTNTYTSLLTGNTYYAKGYGMIDQVINTSSTTTQAVSLIRTPTIN
jgi:hypothetical protein